MYGLSLFWVRYRSFINKFIRFFISIFLRRNLWVGFVFFVWFLSYVHFVFRNRNVLKPNPEFVALKNDSYWIKGFTHPENVTFRECIHTYDVTSKKGQKKASFYKETRWSNLKLPPNSLVLEIGGFQGYDMDQIVSRYDPQKYFVLEPIPMYANKLLYKARNYENVQVLNYGVGSESGFTYIANKRDASSLFSKDLADVKTKVKVLNVEELFDNVIQLKRTKYDLLTMNCEGCEYVVLDHLFRSGLIRNFRFVQFQSHRIKGLEQEMVQKYCVYQILFERSHTKVYQFKFTWELWEIISKS